MTGGGSHRGRVTGGPNTGAHWWGGRGPAGGGSHAASGGRRRLPLALLLVGVLALGGVAIAVAVTGTSDPPPAPAASQAPAVPTVPDGPVPPGATGTPASTGGPDVAVLQDTIDDVLAATPLRFPPDGATPAAGADEAVERLAGALRAAPGPPITVEGHTAPTGEDTDDAQDLSQRRAEEIVRRLEAAGVPAGSLTAVGVGSARPLDSLAASRRVEVRVTG